MPSSDSPQPLPTAFKIDELFDGVRYCLPPRELGALRFLGLVPIVFGVGVAAFALSFAATAAGHPFDQNGDFNWFFLFFLAFTLPFVYASLKTIKIGLFVFGGHSEIEMRAGELRAIDRFGPLRWVRKRPLESVASFRVTSAPDTSASNSRLAGVLTGLAGILVECDSAKQMAMAVAYPQQWLLPLANDLADRWDLAMPDTLTGPSRPPVEVTQGSLESSREAWVVDQTDVAEPPTSSEIEIDAHADGVTLTVPPAGLLKGSKGLFVFSIVWCSITGGISTALFLGGPETWLLIGLFLLVFWSVGIAALLSAINMGRRRAVLAIVDDRLWYCKRDFSARSDANGLATRSRASGWAQADST